MILNHLFDMPKKKTNKNVEPHFQAIVAVFFAFTKSKKGEDPSFDGSAPRDLKSILASLRTRAEAKGIVWTEAVANHRFTAFLEEAYLDRWLSENWILSNINRQKDKVFFNAAKKVQWLGQ